MDNVTPLRRVTEQQLLVDLPAWQTVAHQLVVDRVEVLAEVNPDQVADQHPIPAHLWNSVHPARYKNCTLSGMGDNATVTYDVALGSHSDTAGRFSITIPLDTFLRADGVERYQAVTDLLAEVANDRADEIADDTEALILAFAPAT